MSNTHRNWVFTLHATPDDAERWYRNLNEAPELAPEALYDRASMIFMMFQLEKCPSTGQLHLQGFFCLKKKVRLTQAKKLLDRNTVHLEPMRGRVIDNEIYCGKEDTRVNGPWIFGQAPESQGKRSDLKEAADQIKNGSSLRDIADRYPHTYTTFGRGLQNLQHTLDSCPKWRTLKVVWIYGPTGSGKTRMVMDSVADYRSIFIVHSKGKWWDGYTGEHCILFDDFYGNIECSTMLRYLDGHPLRVPIKGGFVYAKWTRVYITSNIEPTAIYKNVPDDVKAAFLRRINKVKNIV